MTEPTLHSFDEVQKLPSYQLWRLTNAWQRSVRRALEPTGLTHVQFIILAGGSLLAQQGDVKQADIARACDLDENMTSQTVKALACKGYIELRPHPVDARANAVVVTRAGAEALDDARARVRPSNALFFAPLGDRLEGFLAMLIDLNEANARADRVPEEQ